MKKFKVRKNMAKRFGIPEGAIIEYDRLLTTDEKPPELPDIDFAENIYYKGERIGSWVHLDKEDES